MRLPDPASVMVVGAGYAGTRLIRAVRHLNGEGSGVSICAVVDSAQAKLEPWRKSGLSTFTRVDEALAALKPSVVALTVNEHAHVEVLRQVTADGPRHILCEKPLAPSHEEAEEVRAFLGPSPLSMNMVERFSPIVADAGRWLADAGTAEIVRVDFHWGKHRLADPRPTIGILSDVIHPLDLLRVLFDVQQLTNATGCSTATRLRRGGPVVVDSIDFAATADGAFTVTGHASFSWPRRVRTMSALVRDARDRLYRLNLTFDSPHWDVDELVIEEIDQVSGRYRFLHRYTTDIGPLRDGTSGIKKVIAFVRASMMHWLEPDMPSLVVDAAGAVELQHLVHTVVDAVSGAPASARSIFPGEP